MTQIALDTNAYRALDDGNQGVINLVSKSTVVGLPVIVIGELHFGFEDGNKKAENLQRLSRFIGSNKVEVLNTDEVTARIFGEIAAELKAQGQPVQQDDMWIAAICKQNDFTLVTADKGFLNIRGLNTITFKI